MAVVEQDPLWERIEAGEIAAENLCIPPQLGEASFGRKAGASLLAGVPYNHVFWQRETLPISSGDFP